MFVPYGKSRLAQSVSYVANNAANLLANAGMTESLYIPYEMAKSVVDLG